MKRLDGKTSVPSGQLKHTIVGHSGPQVFDVRCRCDHIPCVHNREVGDAKSRLMLSELSFRIGDEAVQKKPAHGSYTEGDEQRYEQ